ncbi:MAG: YcaO-like family protein [Chitinivibrionales bacterium]|nr:YcaO-like family protein [Chitinivibrionales bacterium]
MLKYYPFSDYVHRSVFKEICSEQTGILRSTIVKINKKKDADFNVISLIGKMPDYHKVLMGPEAEIQYHLAGYGTFYEESIIRLVGEGIERYALLNSQFALQHRYVYATYNEIKKRGKVVPFEYLTIYSDEDYKNFEKGGVKGIRRLQPDDRIGWIECPSLLHQGEMIWVPSQMLFVGHKINRDKNEVFFCPGFSTGTASHITLKNALLNAITEFVQLDAFIVSWYTKQKAKRLIIDEPTLLKRFHNLFGEHSKFDVVGLDFTLVKDIPLHCFGVAIINKSDARPLAVLGLQGGLDPYHAFYRGMLEGLTLLPLGFTGPVYAPKEYFNSPSKDEQFLDLDRNVAFYMHPDNASEKRQVFSNLIAGEETLSSLENRESESVDENLSKLIKGLKTVSEYAVYLDITPPETREKGWYVMRVFIPELVTMCLPGIPYHNHPRILKYGGVKNEYPHPTP